MKVLKCSGAVVLGCAFALATSLSAQAPRGPRAGVDWPGFRGIAAAGVDGGATLPVNWSVPDGKLVKWKVPVAGLGHSSPVVWGDLVCTASAISGTPDPQLKVGLYGDIGSVLDTTVHRFIVMCFDKNTGRLRWEQTAKTGVPIVKRHPKSTHASSTLATDGTHIIAFFGSEGLYAYDVKGALVWKKDFGELDSGFFMAPEAQWGFASSPTIHNGRVIVQADVQKGSFVAAFDVRTGQELWRTARADVPTWSTPAVVNMNGCDQVIVNGWKHIGGYDLETGKEVWRMTGVRHYQARLGDGRTGFSASAVSAGGRVYFTSEDGDVYVVKAGTTYELLATNPLGEVAMATPAISEGTFLFRTRGHLVAVGER